MSTMTPSLETAFVFMTNKTDQPVMDRFLGMHSQLTGLSQCYVLLDGSTPEIEQTWTSYCRGCHPDSVQFVPFQISEIARELSVKLFAPGRLVPGSAHLPLLWLSLKLKHRFYWLVEDDVVFTGDWSKFIVEIDSAKYDLLCSHIARYRDIPNWSWWSTLKAPAADVQNSNPLELATKGFFPVYRISARALLKLLDYQRAGWAGHFEVMVPTILRYAGYKIADLNDITPSAVYTPGIVRKGEGYGELSSLRFRPQIEDHEIRALTGPRIFHPVKSREQSTAEVNLSVSGLQTTTPNSTQMAKGATTTISVELEQSAIIKTRVPKAISLCQTSCNRRWQLEQTLDSNLRSINGDCEIVLVDYGSSDGLTDWIWTNYKPFIQNGFLVFFEVRNTVRWSSPRAKNLAHRLSSGRYLFNLDADNFISPSDIQLIGEVAQSGSACHQFSGTFGDGSFGRIGLPRNLFFEIGGYDETMLPMGGQDTDLLRRLVKFGKRIVKIKPSTKPSIVNTFSQKMLSVDSSLVNEELAKNSWIAIEQINQDISKVRLEIEGPIRLNGFQTVQGMLNGEMIVIDGFNRIQREKSVNI